mmetsp:Transcript_20941/g.38794  ORF Transcript_20941/g.38794 Transcript_20941/m.38794 type:complete len:96 (+) Transcript_20941:796-1083(+)
MEFAEDDERLTTRTSSTELGLTHSNLSDEYKDDFSDMPYFALRTDTEEVSAKIASAHKKKKLKLGLKSLSSIRRAIEGMVCEWHALKKHPDVPTK